MIIDLLKKALLPHEDNSFFGIRTPGINPNPQTAGGMPPAPMGDDIPRLPEPPPVAAGGQVPGYSDLMDGAKVEARSGVPMGGGEPDIQALMNAAAGVGEPAMGGDPMMQQALEQAQGMDDQGREGPGFFSKIMGFLSDPAAAWSRDEWDEMTERLNADLQREGRLHGVKDIPQYSTDQIRNLDRDMPGNFSSAADVLRQRGLESIRGIPRASGKETVPWQTELERDAEKTSSRQKIKDESEARKREERAADYDRPGQNRKESAQKFREGVEQGVYAHLDPALEDVLRTSGGATTVEDAVKEYERLLRRYQQEGEKKPEVKALSQLKVILRADEEDYNARTDAKWQGGSRVDTMLR